ncbi:MAG: hypothetical protein APF82_08730 [Sphingomonadales bacterium BRH_c42]|nr:MAG: hypothetical protein APF82_08730 [Sphingomonadales bacterium BRH_c42]
MHCGIGDRLAPPIYATDSIPDPRYSFDFEASTSGGEDFAHFGHGAIDRIVANDPPFPANVQKVLPREYRTHRVGQCDQNLNDSRFTSDRPRWTFHLTQGWSNTDIPDWKIIALRKLDCRAGFTCI